MEDEDIVEGLPTALFMPVGKYRFKHLTGLASLTLPIRGTYEGNGMEGQYDICPEPGTIVFKTLTQAILALGKYPTLQPNQRFILAGLELDGENIIVIGRVVELLEE